MKNLDFLAIGHVCHDWSEDGNILGGTASYASFFARKMGFETKVLTSFGNDFEFQNHFQNISIQTVPSDFTTYFKNEYQGSARQQFLLKKANNIITNQLPQDWASPKMVLLGPIANEVDFDFLEKFENSLVAICPQGWMRRWDEAGKVFQKMISDWTVFKKADLVILSEEDLNYELEMIPRLGDLFKILVVTKADNGADVFFHNKKHTYPAFPTQIKDATGAGDIFATAFLIRFFETKDIEQAATFANAAASLVVEKNGLEGIASREKIMERIKQMDDN